LVLKEEEEEEEEEVGTYPYSIAAPAIPPPHCAAM